VIEHYKDHLSSHPLASEIKATIVSNKIINQAGSSFLSLDIDNENVNLLDHAGCYLTFDRVLEGQALRQAIYALDNKIAAEKQYQLLIQLEKTLAGFSRWALLHDKKIRPDLSTIESYGRFLVEYAGYFNSERLDAAAKTGNDKTHCKQKIEQYQQDGIPSELAQRMVFISSLNDFPFIVSLSVETAQDFVTVLKLFNEITACLGLNKIYDQLAKLPVHDNWERKISTGIQEDMKNITGMMIKHILSSNVESCAKYLEIPAEKQKINRYRRVYQEIDDALPVNLLPYIVLIKELERLVNSDWLAGSQLAKTP